MAVIRAQVILHTVDNIPENFVSNSFAFEVPTPASGATAIAPFIKDFYDGFSGYLSPVLAQNGHEIKWTLLPGTPPNYPFDVDTFNLTSAPAGVALPDEVAVCLSFQGAKGAGFPQARRRGRVYIGPLDTTSASGNRPLGTFVTFLTTAASGLLSDVDGLGAGYAWGVWSPTDGALVPITDGWVDNAFDTQRRRGVLPTSRTTWT